VGRGWTSNKPAYIASSATMVGLQKGDVVLKSARPFDTGLPVGFSDLFGLVSVEITPDMVGQTVAIFTALEVKDDDGRVSRQQANFLDAVKNKGGRAGVARSKQQARAIVLGTEQRKLL
jgi:hypothetical protein